MRGASAGVFCEQEEKMTNEHDPHRIDMMAEARAAQFAADASARGYLKIFAPAKVNLHLAIGERRADGYHEAVSVMHSLALHDVLYMRRVPGEMPAADAPAGQGAAWAGPANNVYVRVECSAREGLSALDVPAERNIAWRAVHELACEVGYDAPDALELYIEKHIPHQAGLGGGSADAAGALLGAARLFGVAADDPAVERVAARLGADVMFFLYGGCAYLDGVGEHFCHALEPMKKSVVLVKPEGGVSTGEAYKTFDAAPVPVDSTLVEVARAACVAESVPLFNNLASASETLMPELARVREWLQAQPEVSDVLLCGSGAATFAVVEGGLSAASRVCAAAGAQGWWARSTMFCKVKAGVQA